MSWITLIISCILLGFVAAVSILRGHFQQHLSAARNEIEQQQAQLRSTKAEARTDSLTKVANRRAFDECLARLFSMRQRHGTEFSLLMLDIDHFKKINDTYGHPIGDIVLEKLAELLAQAIRDMDLVARYGGEEFAVILPKTRLSDAVRVGERIRKKTLQTDFTCGEVGDIAVTISYGLAEVVDSEIDEEFLARTDAALYAAKQSGRNCGFVHNGNSTELATIPVSATT